MNQNQKNSAFEFLFGIKEMQYKQGVLFEVEKSEERYNEYGLKKTLYSNIFILVDDYGFEKPAVKTETKDFTGLKFITSFNGLT